MLAHVHENVEKLRSAILIFGQIGCLSEPRNLTFCIESMTVETRHTGISLATPLGRIVSVDRRYTLAAFGIVWFHMAGRFVRRQWQRLLEPWICGPIVYGPCKMPYALTRWIGPPTSRVCLIRRFVAHVLGRFLPAKVLCLWSSRAPSPG